MERHRARSSTGSKRGSTRRRQRAQEDAGAIGPWVPRTEEATLLARVVRGDRSVGVEVAGGEPNKRLLGGANRYVESALGIDVKDLEGGFGGFEQQTFIAEREMK